MQVVTIDDRDSRIVYSSSWMQGGSQPEVDRTTTYAVFAGATATLQFSNAATISVWGTIGTSGLPPQSSYTIDNGLPVNFTAAQEAYIQYQVNFFVSSVSPGPHTLVITTSIDGGQYYLDYIQVIPPLPNGNCPVVQASSDSSKGSITSSSSTAASNTFTQLQSESITPSGGKSSISVGGILGITVGCTACAAVMVIVIYHLTIRRRKKKNQTYICEPGFVAVTTPRISPWTFPQFAGNATVPTPFPFVTENSSESSAIPPPY